MPRYRDPIDTLFVDPPAGWTLDRYSSTLTAPVFVPWERTDESLHAIVRPPRVSAEAPAQAWLDDVVRGVPSGTTLTRLPCGEGDAVAASLHGAHGVTRVAFVRGSRLDAIVEHRGARDEPRSQAVLPRAVASLFVPVNHVLPPASSHARVSELQEDCRTAQAQGDVKAQIAALRAWRDAAAALWLASLLAENDPPDLNAAESVATAAAALGALASELRLVRDAEEIVLRMRRFVPQVARDAAHEREWTGRCSTFLARFATLQSSLAGITAPAPKPLQILDGRGHALLRHAVDAGKRHELAEAAGLASVALDDFLLELAQLGHQARAASTDADLRIAGNAVSQRAVVEGLQRAAARDAAGAAHLVYVHAMDRQDAMAARESSGLALALTEFAGIDDDEDRRRLVLAANAHAGALLFAADAVSLREADALLDRAQKLLDAMAPAPSLRAETCRNHAWVRHYQRDAKGGAELCRKALEAYDAIPADSRTDGDLRMRRSIESLHSQFLLHRNDVEGALKAARFAVDTPTPISSNLLNLALCEDKAGLHDDALLTLRRALGVALPDNPVGQDVVRILFVASAFSEPRDMAVALDLHDATQALLDAQRTRSGEDDVKVAFDEASHHLEVAQTLVGRLVAGGDYGAALVAADRSRARVLLELLDAPGADTSSAPSRVDAAPDTPLEPEPLQAFRTAATIVRGAAARIFSEAGAPAPLDQATLFDTVKRSGRPALLLQPEGNRLHLFCMLPQQAVIVATSPVALDRVTEAVRTAQQALGVFALARARGGGRLKLADVEDEAPALDTALDLLSDAVIAPFSELLAKEDMLPLVFSARGMTLVPYRELALLPFALLRTPSGARLIEACPLSQVPSIATLRAICLRPRPPPRRCLVYGEPALDARHRLEALPGAAAEAQEVARLLVASRLAPAGFEARTGAAATESAFRADSLDAALVHLACHAAAREPAWQSALYLAPSATHDGLLLPHEIAQAQLANALVFLSACQTGLGRPTADGVIGLGRAFLQAGALAVLLSLWRVVDAAAMHLASAFYRDALGVGQPAVDAATALQQAMLATRDALRAGAIRTEQGETLDDHPAHWAPFALLGEGSLSLRARLAQIERD